MRLFLLLAVLPWLGQGCSPSSAAARATDGTLQLEVGGGHGSLRGALQAAGLEVGAPQSLRPVLPPPEASPVAAEPTKPPSDAADAAAPVKDEGAPPTGLGELKPTSDYLVVTLGPRQNLIQLAKKHLGNGNRFRDIMALNGWDEADTRRLQPGQKVKIPRAAAAGAPRR